MKKPTKRVTGIGGIFFKAKDPEKLRAWYKKHLGLPIDPAWGGWPFEWREAGNPKAKGMTVWNPFEAGSDYFGAKEQRFMVNYRVANLKKVVAALKKEGVWVDPKIDESEWGKFAWIKDSEGQRIELWEPPKPKRTRKK